jgi:hypothetical protein
VTKNRCADLRFVGDGQLSYLGMQVTDRVLGNLGGGRCLTATLEDASGPFEQSLLPLVDHRRMHLIGGRQFRHRALALQRLQRNTRLERRVMVPAFRHNLISSDWGSADLRS